MQRGGYDMNRSQFVRMIGLELIKKLKELELENEDFDVMDLLRHHAAIRIIPMEQMIPVADEAVQRDDAAAEQIMGMQQEILSFVLEELKKESKPEMLN